LNASETSESVAEYVSAFSKPRTYYCTVEYVWILPVRH